MVILATAHKKPDGAVIAPKGQKAFFVKPATEAESKVLDAIVDGEMVFVDGRRIVTNFNHGTQDEFFQKKFGNEYPAQPTRYERLILRDMSGVPTEYQG